jgi:NADPH-dependent F420 reductase
MEAVMTQSFGILGGTGPAGRGVALRLATAGYDVILGSRDATRAAEVAAGMAPQGSGVISGGDNAAAAQADVVIVATPWDSAVATVKDVKDALAGKTVVSMVNALAKEGRELTPLYPPRGSMAAQIAFALPQSHIVGAFHHLPAAQMEDLSSGLEADVIVFGDHAASRDAFSEIVSQMPGLTGIVAGSMSLAAPVEAFTAVCISVNIRHKAHSYVRLAGLSH